ncbi:MAG: phosphoribosylglycinamide synthetase C domain-containing protein, partial [Candidatus Limnocylindrales bacterium]
DPETQAILPRLADPLLPVLRAAATGRLTGFDAHLRTTDDEAVALTLAVAGYPTSPRIGDEILGIAEARAAGVLVFGAGVTEQASEAGALVTSGGRVLTVVGRGSDLAEAADRALSVADRITFDGRQMRRDIGRATAGAVA